MYTYIQIYVLFFSVETAMGTKTGESRTLVDTVEREWHMTLPSPLPLSTLGCYLQVLYTRNVNVYRWIVTVISSRYMHIYKYMLVLQVRSATLGYTLHSSTDPKVILRNITLDIQRDSKIGLVVSILVNLCYIFILKLS